MKGPARITRRLRLAALGAAVASVMATGLSSAAVPAARGNDSAPAGPLRDVIVQVRGTAAAGVAAAVRAAGGTVDEALPVVNGFAAHVPAAALDALRARPDVRAVTENSAVRFATTGYDETTVASSFATASGAAAAWSAGHLGEGVGVAVIDTGVSPMNDLAGRLVHGPDLSGEGTYVDSYGHGTVMGGIVAGSGADSAGHAGGRHAGVAPKATLVSVKVAGRNGAADVSTMLQAMHWVSAYRQQFNIRVLNLSWGTDSTADPATDPLNYAVQRLWRQGVVVVVAAGNAGPGAGTISKPADDPLALTVGAYNDGGNTNPADDTIPSWSARGPSAHGLAKPDVVAPGRTLIATRSYGSKVEQDNPKALVAPSYVKGSGTSQAAAVVSGLAALLAGAHPDWTPDQVKHALRSTAVPINGGGTQAQGSGRVSYAAATNADVSAAPVQSSTATGVGSIEASRGSVHVTADCRQDGTRTVIEGEQDAWCRPWTGASWAGSEWTGDAWTGASWAGASWAGASWAGASWADATWTGASWAGGTWTGASWAGASWAGASWAGASWAGASWAGASWAGASWAGASWASAGSGDGGLFMTAFFGNRPRYGQSVAGEAGEPRPAVAAGSDE
ncbi:MAG TPA: S8 family serine peptidase [Frankiaceae bacterium]|nr:S8 family serine peptidase [Frankiaceae bacterium]